MPAPILHWIAQYGPIALFGLLTLGVFGLPVPDETLLTFAGVLVSQGNLPFGKTWVAASLGSMIGITLSYTLGRTAGPAFVNRFGKWIHVGREELDRFEAWLLKTGKWALVFGYFVPGVRHLTGIAAGSSRLPLPVFALFAYGGACLWSSVFVLLGWYVGDEWQAVLERMHRHMLIAAAVLVVSALAFALARRRWVSQTRD